MWLAFQLLFLESARALNRHRARSALAALGICIGAAALVAVVAVGRAGMQRTEASLQALGDNLVWVEAGSRNVNGVRTGTHGMNSLTVGDLEAILREVPLIRTASPNVDGSVMVIHGDRNWTTHYRGVSPAYFEIKNWPVTSGAPFTDDDAARRANVCVIGQTLRRQLFGEEDPIGQTVLIANQIFRVVGVLAPKGQSGHGHDRDDTVILPFTTVQSKIRGRGYAWLDDILCSASSPAAIDAAAERITALLRQRHHIGPGEMDDFNIRRPDQLIKARIASSRTLQILLSSLAAIALLVGGIGIMNVMLVSVAQRTSEIGVRLAVGATPGQVMVQFLGESMMVGLFGGGAGLMLSGLGTRLLGGWLGWSIRVPMDALVLALGAAVLIGLFFGVYPAWRAARLSPIEALRRE